MYISKERWEFEIFCEIIPDMYKKHNLAFNDGDFQIRYDSMNV